MALLGIDLGGTKLGIAVFTEDGNLLHKEIIFLHSRKGPEIGKLIARQISGRLRADHREHPAIQSIGISVPGIFRSETGTVWAPNIDGWDDYPLLEEIKKLSAQIPVTISCDRTCYILGERWKGNAMGCQDAIFLAVGTGIGAGILINGIPLRGAHDIAGAIGWMALTETYREEYIECGCFEHYASGEGIAKLALETMKSDAGYSGELSRKEPASLTSADIFKALENEDTTAKQVIRLCIGFWGMAIANLISLFNPEKIILGGGVFGPALKFLPDIEKEVKRWAQPVSVLQCRIEGSVLGGDAGLYGAGYLALHNQTPLYNPQTH